MYDTSYLKACIHDTSYLNMQYSCAGHILFLLTRIFARFQQSCTLEESLQIFLNSVGSLSQTLYWAQLTEDITKYTHPPFSFSISFKILMLFIINMSYLCLSSKNLFWSIKNSGEILDKLKARDFNATSLSTYDFSNLYTTLPHNLIKDKLIDLIERTFQREGSPYLACNDRNAFFTSEKPKK